MNLIEKMYLERNEMQGTLPGSQYNSRNSEYVKEFLKMEFNVDI